MHRYIEIDIYIFFEFFPYLLVQMFAQYIANRRHYLIKLSTPSIHKIGIFTLLSPSPTPLFCNIDLRMCSRCEWFCIHQ